MISRVLILICLYVARWALGAIGADAQRTQARREADEVAVVRTIAGGAVVSEMGHDAACDAIDRLLRRGEIVRGIGCFHLTRAGWARIGRPLTLEQFALLRNLRDDPLGGRTVHHADVYALRSRGLIRAWTLTPAGHAAIEDRHGQE